MTMTPLIPMPADRRTPPSGPPRRGALGVTMSRSVVLAILLAVAGCAQPESAPSSGRPLAGQPDKDPAAARAVIASGAAVVIDVRTADEYSSGHLDGAINLPVQELPARMSEVDKLVAGDRSRPIVVYCAAGSRAAKAKAELEAAGYARVINGGGFDDLR